MDWRKQKNISYREGVGVAMKGGGRGRKKSFNYMTIDFDDAYSM